MTDTRPPACHHDRALGYRATSRHHDDCPRDHTCPGTNGCAPCDQQHCALCGREHTTYAQPQTCPECLGKVDDDLADLARAYADLHSEALDAGHDGRLAAAAPIPGGTAAVLTGPTVRLDQLRVGRGGLTDLTKDHRPKDPIPPLAILAQWEDIYRAWLNHRTSQHATLPAAVDYLRTQLAYIAQRTDGPDFLAFTRQVRRLRSQLEHALHDEREPEKGVECFECGDRLVRRFRDATRCRHQTPARRDLTSWLQRRATAQAWLRTLATYPELEGPRVDELRAADAPPASLLRDARRPCEPCGKTQGGIDDPRAGRSWECPGCRKEYTPGEYATAVRSSLVGGADGWCTLQAAADAASDITGRTLSATTVRTWVARGDDIAVCCLWRARPVEGTLVGDRFGTQLVYWPDVLTRATERRSRGRRPVAV